MAAMLRRNRNRLAMPEFHAYLLCTAQLSGISTMTKTAQLQLPAMPKFDVEALVGLHKANVETFVAAQKILFDLAQTVAKKQPAVYADELKVAVEKAMAEVKETVDLGIKAQSEVVDLFVKRATANFQEIKAVAA